MKGRKPIPTKMKVLRGNPGNRPLNENEPQPEACKNIGPPKHLSGVAKKEWKRTIATLQDLGIVTNIDIAVLAAYCQAYGRWVQTETMIAEMAVQNKSTNGYIVKTTNGNIIQSPLVGIANKAAIDMVRFAVELGMTPSARSRVSVGKTKENENEFDNLGKKTG